MKKQYYLVVIILLAVNGLSMMTIPRTSATDDFALRVRQTFWGTNFMMPDTAFVGEESKPLSLMIVNSGAAIAFDVRTSLYVEYPFAYNYIEDKVTNFATKLTAYAGIIPAGNFSIISYHLNIDPDAEEGTYRMQVQLEYEDGMGNYRWRLRTIDVIIYGPENSLIVQDVITDPVKIHPGDSLVNYKVTIFNDGKTSYKEVSLEFQLIDPFVPSSSGSDHIFLGTISPDQLIEANFLLDVSESATAGIYRLELLINYFPFTKPIITQVPLVINEKAQFSVVSVEPNAVFAGEDTVVVAITVKNISPTATTDGVWATLKAGNLFEGTTADYLGTLQPGESKTASFVLDIDEKAQGTYKFDLDIDWTQKNKEFDESLLVTIDVTQKQWADFINDETLLYLGGSAILIILIAIGIAIRRWRRKS